MATHSRRGGKVKTRRVAGFLGNTLLNLAAFGGLICLVFVLLAVVFDVTLIMFRTGSMGPTIPAGSVAVVHEIAAGEIEVGDVVTVDRAGALPITHRVTSVAAVDGSADRLITMKGDANVDADPAPYRVATVRIVLGSLPGLAFVVVWFANPWVLGSLALGASVLVTWAFWPREPRGGSTDDPTGPAAPATSTGALVATGVVTAALALCASGLIVSPAAHAASDAPPVRPSSPSEQIIRGSNLELLSIGDQAEMARVSWTDSVEWQVGVTSTTTETGSVVVNLIGTGSSLLGLFDTISSCPERWVHHSCASGATLISAPAAVPVDGISRQLAQFDAAENTWFMIRLWRNHSNDIGAETVQLRLRASGASGELTASPARVASLPGTGTNIYLPAIVSGGAITLGLATAGLARLTRRWWPAEPEPQLQ